MKTVRRRRLQRRTDYKSRLGLLKAGQPRLVVRKTNRYILAQLVETEIAQDKVLVSMSTKFLLSKGWPSKSSGSLKSLAAGYILGGLIGKVAKQKKLGPVILDIGMNRNIQKSRIYAVLKGAIDSGLKINHNPEALPSLEDIKKKEELAPLIDKILGGSD